MSPQDQGVLSPGSCAGGAPAEVPRSLARVIERQCVALRVKCQKKWCVCVCVCVCACVCVCVCACVCVCGVHSETKRKKTEKLHARTQACTQKETLTRQHKTIPLITFNLQMHIPASSARITSDPQASSPPPPLPLSLSLTLSRVRRARSKGVSPSRLRRDISAPYRSKILTAFTCPFSAGRAMQGGGLD